MRDLRGAVAVVTGAAGGIGAGLATALAGEGARLVLADVADLSATETSARAAGASVLALRADVSDPADMERLADEAYAAFGAVNLLCCNAGVVLFGPLAEMSERDWDWILSVNVRGVINGVTAFLPRMLRQRDGRHILITASGAGLVASGAMPLGAYTTSKFAVVGFAESLRNELEPHGIPVTILCPGSVQTGILDAARYTPGAERLRPQVRGAATPSREGVRRMQPAEVARLAIEGIRADEPYVLTHPESFGAVEARFAALQTAAATAAARLVR